MRSEIDNLHPGIVAVVAVTAFFALIVVVLFVYFAIKYRDDTRDKVGAPITGWMRLELGWSLIPFFISIGIFVWASIVFFHIVRGP
jgi:cytochrome c oxidase subunit 2